MSMPIPPQHQVLTQRLDGQKLYIPALGDRFEHWFGKIPHSNHQSHLNSKLNKLRVEVDLMISSVTEDTRTLEAAASSDMALLTCLWFPHAGWEELKTAAAYLAWVFLWDDINHGTTQIWQSLESGREYCKKSLDFIQEAMGFSEFVTWVDTIPYPCMSIFKRFGHTLRDTVDKDQKLAIYHSLKLYITQVGLEHARQLTGVIPNPPEYLEMRRGTTVIAPVCACAEYMNRVKLPTWVVNSEEMASMSRESTFLYLVINDIYSAPKEIAARTFQNYVTVLMNESPPTSIDIAVTFLMSEVDRSIKCFDTAFATLDAKTKEDKRLNHEVRLCVDSRRRFVTGLITWSLNSSRYDLHRHMQDDGSVVVPLELDY